MTGEPAQIIRRVKSRSSRTRDSSPPALETSDDSPVLTPHTLATKLKNKQKRSRPKSNLSFGIDDQVSDGEMFKVKKSNLSRKLTLGSAPSPPGAAVPSNLDQASISPRPTGPTYTKEYLKELKASTPSTPVSRLPTCQTDSDTSFDTSFDIDGAVVENASQLFGESAIPSAASISAAKERRGRLRDTGTDDGFISLSVAKREDAPPGPHPESRLMREEDELGEGEDEMAEYTGAQERIALGKKGRKDEERKRRMGMAEMIEDAEEEDEETVEWERAQARRAGPVDDDRCIKLPEATYTPAPIPSIIPIPTLASAVTRLTGSLTTLTSSHATHTAALSSLADERSTLERKGAEMRQMIEKAERKRSWFVAFREWVEGVANFLDEKFPQLERLEDEHVSLLTERYDMVSKRRRTDDEDDLALCLGVPPPASYSEPEETDELGRVVPPQNTTPAIRAARRIARSNRRLLRRARHQAPRGQDEEGYSTDGSLPSADADDFRIALGKMEGRKVDVLADVRANEFRDPRMGLGKWFGEWRQAYEESYVGAWGGLGLVAAWEFWGRLEMVGWDPIEDTSRGLDSFEWSTALHDYSRPHQDADMGVEDDIELDIGPGGDMVSSMISQAVIPRLCKLVEGGAFDPYSTSHVRRMIDVSEQVEASVEHEGVRFQTLLKSAFNVFHDAVISTQALLAPSLGPTNPGAPFDPQSLPARRRFLMRRLKLLENLIRWRKYTGERVGIGELASKLINTCILAVAEKGWEMGGEDALRKVVEMTPPELVPANLTMRLR